MDERWYDARFTPEGGWWLAEDFASKADALAAFPDEFELSRYEDGDPEPYVSRQVIPESLARRDPMLQEALSAFLQQRAEVLELENAVLRDELRLTNG